MKVTSKRDGILNVLNAIFDDGDLVLILTDKNEVCYDESNLMSIFNNIDLDNIKKLSSINEGTKVYHNAEFTGVVSSVQHITDMSTNYDVDIEDLHHEYPSGYCVTATNEQSIYVLDLLDFELI